MDKTQLKFEMKDYNFVTWYGWMVNNLHLKSPELDIYAAVFCYSQDGVSAFRGGMEMLMRLCRRKERTTQYALKALVEADYIRRVDIGIGAGAFMELRVNLEIAEKAMKGAKFAPIKRVQLLTKKGATFDEKRVQLLTSHNSIYILNYKNRYLLRSDAESDAEQKEEFFKIFFFKNCKDPGVEVEEFWTYNSDVCGWKTSDGKEFKTFESRLWLADNWKFNRTGTGRVGSIFIDIWRETYNEAVRAGDPFAPQLLQTNISDLVETDRITITAPEDVQAWLNEQTHQHARIYEIFKKWLNGRKLFYTTPIFDC